MTVPATILAMLQKSQNISYTLTEAPPTNELLTTVPTNNLKCLVKGLILKDSQNQQVQVLVPSNAIVDVDAMFRNFGRQFVGVPSDDVWKMINSKELNTVPGIPEWQSMPTYVDESLAKKETLILDSGDSQNLIQISNKDFKELVKTCNSGAFTVPAPELSNDKSDDKKHILNSVKKFTERRIRQRLEETIELPPLPETAQRIIKLRADPNADISDLTNIVEIDPSLSAQVVSWAASPYYSAPGKIKSVHDAIVRVLGFDMMLNLALGLALGKTLSMNALSKQDISDYWRNSVYVAAAVEGLVTSISREHRPSFGMAYLSGLLNNFGNLILAEIFPPYFDLLKRARSANPHLPSDRVESHLLGVSGNQIAGWLLESWSLPEEVVEALRFQNDTAYDGESVAYAKLIYVAKQLLANKGFGDILPADIPASVFESLHLDKDMALATIDNIFESGDDLDSIAEKMRG